MVVSLSEVVAECVACPATAVGWRWRLAGELSSTGSNIEGMSSSSSESKMAMGNLLMMKVSLLANFLYISGNVVCTVFGTRVDSNTTLLIIAACLASHMYVTETCGRPQKMHIILIRVG